MQVIDGDGFRGVIGCRVRASVNGHGTLARVVIGLVFPMLYSVQPGLGLITEASVDQSQVVVGE